MYVSSLNIVLDTECGERIDEWIDRNQTGNM